MRYEVNCEKCGQSGHYKKLFCGLLVKDMLDQPNCVFIPDNTSKRFKQ